jgi:septation ring formation regulator EzrA
MNNIYKCAIIQSQIDGLERVRNILIKNNIALQKRIEKKLENKKKKLELISNTIGKKRDIIEDDIEKIENDINEIETQEEKNEKNIDKSEEVIEDTLESLDKG